jgi:hypothetical protein
MDYFQCPGDQFAIGTQAPQELEHHMYSLPLEVTRNRVSSLAYDVNPREISHTNRHAKVTDYKESRSHRELVGRYVGQP